MTDKIKFFRTNCQTPVLNVSENMAVLFGLYAQPNDVQSTPAKLSRSATFHITVNYSISLIVLSLQKPNFHQTFTTQSNFLNLFLKNFFALSLLFEDSNLYQSFTFKTAMSL